MTVERVRLPLYYEPYPYQIGAWQRRTSGKYHYYFKLWARQCLSPDTPVQTPYGLVPLCSLKKDSKVISLGKDGEYTVSNVKDTWMSANDKPCIKITVEGDYLGTLSYNHPIYYNGTYQKLYRVIWRAMDADQRNKLALLCLKYGQSLELQGIQQEHMDSAKTCTIGQVCLQGRRISSGSVIPRRRQQMEAEGTQTSSSVFHSESRQLAASESQGREYSEQQSREFRMVHQRRESQVFKQIELGISEQDSESLEQDKRSDVDGKLLQVDGGTIRCEQKRHTICIEAGNLEILEPMQLMDIEVEDTHNLLLGYQGMTVANCGKDADDIEYCLNQGYLKAGLQIAYVGLDNIWVTNNIFKKYIDGRTFWEDYPPDLIDVKDTAKEVFMASRTPGKADTRIKFIGFLNNEGIIGSSYDQFYISEASLYRPNAFEYITPIWERKLKMTGELSVNFNGTPRGLKNVYYDLLRTYTGMDDPDDFPGAHGDCYVDKITIADATDRQGNKLYTKEEIEELRDRYIRAYGNDNLFRQENFCDFTVVNAGLVYLAIEQLVREKRYCSYNLDTQKPVYIAFDIASKGKESDSTAAIVYQYINNRMIIYDVFESRGISLVQAMAEIAKKPYFHLIRMGILPWDSERSASSMTPKEEVEQIYPNINWHSLDKERVDRGIQLVREQIPNMIINSDNCDWLMECFNNYEYKRLSKSDDWAPKPMHNKYSHMMDAIRYGVMGIKEIQYLGLNSDGSMPIDWDQSYDDSYSEESNDSWIPATYRRKEKKTNGGLYYYG